MPRCPHSQEEEPAHSFTHSFFWKLHRARFDLEIFCFWLCIDPPVQTPICLGGSIPPRPTPAIFFGNMHGAPLDLVYLFV